MRILLADDDSFYRHLLKSTLEEWGYEVVPASDGTEAWEKIQSRDAPRLVLLDWMMPGMNGLEICQKIRKSPDLKSTYVIMASVREDKGSTIEGLENGADDYLSKPVDLGELRARVRTGERVVRLQDKLLNNVTDLEIALTQSQKLEAMGRLAGGVAHDFNNLLTVVYSAGAFLEEAVSPSSELAEHVQMILDATERGASLTRQLLAFSRKQMVVPQVLDLNELLTHIHRLLTRLIGESILFEMNLCDGPVLIKADPGQIEQVVMNLAVNSRDAMPEGGRFIVKTESIHRRGLKSSEPPEVRLTVSDTGCGMGEDTLQHIFEPFFTTREAGKGTGLGLATVYGIVQQNAGQIQVQSEPGRGTTFQIAFPQSREGLSGIQQIEPKKVEVGQGETILVAEDDDAVRKVIRHALLLKRYNVLEARDGQEALALGKEHDGAIDLLLTDTVMPHVPGPELADRLSQHRPGLKVLYVSGYTDDCLLRQRILQAGVPFLAKPFSITDLVGKVRDVLLASPVKCYSSTAL